MHSGEKSNKCNQCDYASSYASNLRAHLKTHSGEKSNKSGLGVQSINGTEGIFSLWKMNCETPITQWQPNIFCYLLSAVAGFSHKFFLKAIWSLVVLPDTDHWDAVEVEPSPFMKLKMVWNQLRWLFQPVAHCGRGQTWNIWTSQLSGGWIWILEPLKWK